MHVHRHPFGPSVALRDPWTTGPLSKGTDEPLICDSCESKGTRSNCEDGLTLKLVVRRIPLDAGGLPTLDGAAMELTVVEDDAPCEDQS